MERFAFAFDPRVTKLLSVLGARPSTSAVTVTDDDLDVRFGPWHLTTPLTNVRSVQVTGPYSLVRVIGPRLSLKDGGVTLGSSPHGGTCVLFHEPVPLLFGRLRPHPGLTVTVLDPDGLVEALERRLPRAEATGG